VTLQTPNQSKRLSDFTNDTPK